MHRNSPAGIVMIAFLTTTLAGVAIAGETSGHHHDHHQQPAKRTMFADLARSYESIRLALFGDSLEGLSDEARSIEQRTASLLADFDAERAGVPAASAPECKPLLPKIVKAANQLAGASTLADARAAFGELSEPLIRYRELTRAHRPVVAYCAMAKKSWLQPEGEIGNPYYGQRMARCGEIVSR
ncbi:MAG: DUF3347 domain-containing protein [Acidobacteriota bacterium]|nr:MAG: DUF3347 domain-containing protein [Acidobacteriota bacterium]